MRIAIVSDIHGNLAALEAVAADITQRVCDAVINLGDSLSGPLLPKETAQFLMAQNWTHLAGNHERQLLTLPPEKRSASDNYAHAQLTSAEFAWMASLTHSKPFNDEVYLCHGTPTSDITYFLESVDTSGWRPARQHEVDARLGDQTASVVLCGHTHVPRSVRASSGQLIVNPGSVGLQAYDDDRPYFHLIENGSPDARYAIIEKRNGEWHTQLLSIVYDHLAMAQLAKQRARLDWEYALLTGYMPKF